MFDRHYATIHRVEIRVPDICLALGPPALAPTPVQAKTQPAALTENLRGSLMYRSLGIAVVRMMCS